MNSMRDWICPRIREAIHLCSVNLPEEVKGGRGRGRRSRWKLARIQSLENEFQIGVRKCDMVQVVKWLELESPVEAILSDSITTIRARFSNDSVAEYAHKKKANIRSNTKGALMKLIQFDIVLGRKGAESPRIELYVRRFDIEGCEGTATFGNPCDILKSSSVSDLFRKLQFTNKADSVNERITRSEADSGPSVSATTDEDSRLSDSHQSSQAAISTQIETHKGLDLLNRSKRPHMTSPTKLSSEELLTRLSSNPQERRFAPNRVTRAPSPVSSSGSGNCDKVSMPPPPKPGARTSAKDRPSPSPPHRPGMTSSKLVGTKDKENLPEANLVGSTSLRTVTSPISQSQNSKDQCSPSRSPNHHGKDTNNIAEAHNGYLSLAYSTGRRRGGALNDADPWKNWKRISRRDVFIPKDQETLIEKFDSWVPPLAGQTLAPGRVPIKLLQKWNVSQIEKSQAKDSPQNQSEEGRFEKRTEPSVEDELFNRSTSCSSPATSHCGTDEWSRSSAAGLPPDSSPNKSTPKRSSHLPSNSHTPGSLPGHIEGVNSPENGTDNPRVVRADSDPAEQVTVFESEQSDASDIETSIPTGLETSMQESQTCLELAQDEPITSSEPSLPPPKASSFTQVKRSRENVPSPGQARVRAGAPRERGGKLILPTDLIENTSKLPSDAIIPATFGSDNVRRQSQNVDMTEEPTKDSLLISSSNGLDSDGINAEKQLISELGGFIQASQAQSTRFRDAFSTMGLDEIIDTPCPNVRRRDKPNIQKKRKRDSSSSGRPRSPKRRIKEAEPAVSEKRPGATEGSVGQPLLTSFRQSFFTRASPSSAVEKVFLKFKEAYSIYDGDIHTFTESCLQIRCLRSRGLLAKSILWDDFVCREVKQYRDYCQRCRNTNGQPETYEQYFLRRVTVPIYKKRNLTIKNIDTVASWREEARGQPDIISVSDTELTASQRAEAFELGLRERDRESSGKKLEAVETLKSKPLHLGRSDSVSIADSEEWRVYDTHETASLELGDTEDSHPLSGAQKQTELEYDEVQMDDASIASTADESIASIESSVVDSPSQLRQSRREIKPLAERQNESDSPGSEIEERPSRSELKGKRAQYLIDRESELKPLQEFTKNDKRSLDEAIYTADYFYAQYRPPRVGDNTKASDDTTTTTEHRAGSPTSNWWRDSNTPFKSFARAYTNLHSELGRYRRPGVEEAVPVDENGVILPHKLLNPDNSPVKGMMDSMGWKL